jgi:transcriptional regulator with XRE-family HTH domain
MNLSTDKRLSSPDKDVKHIRAMSANEFADWLKQQLIRRQWSQAVFARRAGVTDTAVSLWVSGKRLPDAESCDKIAEALFVSRDEVLARAGLRPVEHEDAEDVRELIGLIRRITWNEDRLRFVRSVLVDLAAHTPVGGGSRIPLG